MPNRYPNVPLTRSGVIPFKGAELREHRGVDPHKWYFVLRSPDVLRAAIDEFNGTPLLNIHRRTLGLDAARWQRNIVGATGTKARLDDDGFVRNAVTIWTPEALDNGRELSVGFRSEIELVRGRNHDAEVRRCCVDHIFVGERCKLGSDCFIDVDGDHWRQLADVLAGFGNLKS